MFGIEVKIEAFVVKHSAYVNAHESQHYYMSFTTTKFTLKESCLFREGALLFVSPLCQITGNENRDTEKD